MFVFGASELLWIGEDGRTLRDNSGRCSLVSDPYIRCLNSSVSMLFLDSFVSFYIYVFEQSMPFYTMQKRRYILSLLRTKKNTHQTCATDAWCVHTQTASGLLLLKPHIMTRFICFNSIWRRIIYHQTSRLHADLSLSKHNPNGMASTPQTICSMGHDNRRQWWEHIVNVFTEKRRTNIFPRCHALMFS